MPGWTSRRTFLQQVVFAGTAAVLGRTAHAVEPVSRAGPARLRLSCCAYSFRKYLTGKEKSWALEDFIDRCIEWGLDGAELTSYYFAETSAAYCRHLRRRCFLGGLDVSGTALGNTFAVAPGPEREAQLAKVRQWVDLAAAMGAPCIRVFGGPVPKDVAPDQAQAWVIEALQEAASAAEERGVFLALENHGGVTATPDGVLAILQAIDSDWVGANLDTGNFHGDDPYAEIARVAPYAVNVHLKAEMRAAGKPAEPADFTRIAQILRGAGYQGYLSLEYESAEEPLTAVPRTLQEIREAIT